MDFKSTKPKPIWAKDAAALHTILTPNDLQDRGLAESLSNFSGNAPAVMRMVSAVLAKQLSPNNNTSKVIRKK